LVCLQFPEVLGNLVALLFIQLAAAVVLLGAVALKCETGVYGKALDTKVAGGGGHLLIAVSLMLPFEDLLAQGFPGSTVEWTELGIEHRLVRLGVSIRHEINSRTRVFIRTLRLAHGKNLLLEFF